ncbi:MAG: sigma-70 family RNA polymerase sigma factor [Ktedonobacteraceae bacterium]|nr:sigma-70 family RNA polymerase sigma factor [Ktedonobacteraceae bacterium]
MSTGEPDELLKYEGNTRIEDVLAQYDSFIVALVREQACQDPTLIRAAVRDLEIDDLAQLVRIKLWHALEEKEILYPKAYIRRIVHSEVVDMARRQKKPLQELPEDEEGEIYHGKILVTQSEGMIDPAEVVEEKEQARERMSEVAGIVLNLPKRQQHAMICTLRERIDDTLLLINAFKSHQCDVRQWQWPQMRKEKVLLQASLSYARHTLMQSISSGSALKDRYLPLRKRNKRKQLATAGRGSQS